MTGRIRREPRLDGVKVCVRCGITKPRLEYSPSTNTMDGRQGACRECERLRSQLARHRLTAADKAMIAARQGGCAICRRRYPGARGWVVDHDRSCCPGDRSCEQCVRGVLCGWCNRALGYAGDSPEVLRRMADYLDWYAAAYAGRMSNGNARAPVLTQSTDGRDGPTEMRG